MSKKQEYIVGSKNQAPVLNGITVGHYVKQQLDRVSDDRIVLIDGTTDQKYTKAEIELQTNEIASALIDIGLKSEDCVLLYGDNLVEYYIVNLAMIYLGVATSPITPANGAYESGLQMAQIRGKFMFVSSSKLPVIRQMMEDERTGNAPLISSLQYLVIMDSDSLTETEMDLLGKHRNSPQNITTFQKLRKIGNGKRSLELVPYFDVKNPDIDSFIIVFTSGTTGNPKGVIQSHLSIVSAVECTRFSFAYKWYPESRIGLIFPYGHISGTFFMLFQLIHRMTGIMFSGYSPRQYIASIERYRINLISMLPEFSLVLNETDFTKKYDLSSMQLVMYGGTKYPKILIENIRDRYRVVMSDMYGASELMNGVGNLEQDYPFGSVGSPVPNIEMKIIDLKTGDSLPSKQEGEIFLRGPNRFVKYLNNPKETGDSIDNEGWYRTGDVGYFDEERRLFITDRIKELFKYKYWTISPAEVEGFMKTHPAVFDSCAVGVPHKTEGFHLRVYVQMVEGLTVTEEELVKFVKVNMSYYNRITGGIRFIADIPRTSIGKVDRKYFKNLVKDELLTKLAQVDCK